MARGYIIAMVSAVFLSTTAIFIRYLTLAYQMPSLILAFWRDLFVTLTLLLVMGIIRPRFLKIQRRHLFFLSFYGLMLAIFNSLWTLSVALNGAAVATVLVYCSAVFTVILGWGILKESFTWVKILSATICLAGCVFVSGAQDPTIWHSNPSGIITGILSGLWYAIYSLMGRSASQRGLNPWTTLIYTFGIAALLLFSINLYPESRLPGSAQHPIDLFWLGNALPGWTILFLLAAVPTIAGFGLYNVSLTYLPSSVANLVLTLEPAFTAVTAYFVLGERLTNLQIFGSLMILAGVIFLRVTER